MTAQSFINSKKCLNTYETLLSLQSKGEADIILCRITVCCSLLTFFRCVYCFLSVLAYVLQVKVEMELEIQQCEKTKAVREEQLERLTQICQEQAVSPRAPTGFSIPASSGHV